VRPSHRAEVVERRGRELQQRSCGHRDIIDVPQFDAPVHRGRKSKVLKLLRGGGVDVNRCDHPEVSSNLWIIKNIKSK
jgi:hypothetical protein